MKLTKILTASAMAVSGALLGGCSDGTDGEVIAATTNLVVPANATTVASVKDVPYVFASGVAELGTATATTVKFTSAGAAPAFSISSSEGAATGATTFGSCIFTVVTSTYPAIHPLAQFKIVRIANCGFQFNTAGVNAGISIPVPSFFGLGSVNSASAPVSVVMTDTGSVTVNGTVVGNVTVGVTGGTGGGG
ncbi:hypothetical protein [Roseateles oligotrophus]|uniref:Lipoprotein n=1 Tax=Roseateles oligotrophus TaxID=1769250 RepID=A0ABT2YF31_9BURK|nr:hypothetical protein [Roseateles oligotrophus]MCV2368629.1 hypothetical protein [Roseateles oligotrophus]